MDKHDTDKYRQKKQTNRLDIDKDGKDKQYRQIQTKSKQINIKSKETDKQHRQIFTKKKKPKKKQTDSTDIYKQQE